MTNFEITATEANAQAFCKGQALHYFPAASGGDTWTVIGTYNFKLEKIAGYWKVNAIIFNLLHEEGNKNLAAIANNETEDSKEV